MILKKDVVRERCECCGAEQTILTAGTIVNVHKLNLGTCMVSLADDGFSFWFPVDFSDLARVEETAGL